MVLLVHFISGCNTMREGLGLYISVLYEIFNFKYCNSTGIITTCVISYKLILNQMNGPRHDEG